MQLLKASKWLRLETLYFSPLLCCKSLHESSYKNSHRWNHSCDVSSTKTQINKTSQQRNLVSSCNCISFNGGSGKACRVKNAKWQKVSVFDKQAAILSIIIDLSKCWPILVEVVICRREQEAVKKRCAVTRKRGKEQVKFLHVY